MLRTTKIIAACALFTWAGATLAQPNVVRDVVQNVAQLSASGSVEVQQDLLSIAMSTTRDGADASAVQTQLKQALDTALAQARQAAAPGQMDVRTGAFSLQPRYGKDGKINGWQGSTELVLEGRDFLRITATAGKIQTLTLANVGFALSREQRAKVEGEAQALAIERFKGRAADVAKAFGFGSYTLREVSIGSNDQGSPRPYAMAIQARSAMSDAPVSVEAGKSTVTVTVSGSVQMK
ncbi:SIMPL domain-containing protein [Polaromonas sp.]|uniref:SIMPL domain-containing protein n=1 Tax=Polaromonas sp. TaxID=1869339 RepID=UPI002C91FFE6|nr:SIMPL domain-containing protein [Polaromonas sp.]HQS32453.1 SIMPL domain-containing protein [Polaromonas sp.]HQS91688.1 SIMPL domain-containing protein [Polaromonas sp.]